MLDPKMLEDFGAKMSALLANTPARDIEKNAKAMLSGFFGKLDLVTREEFDVQARFWRAPAKSCRPWKPASTRWKKPARASKPAAWRWPSPTVADWMA